MAHDQDKTGSWRGKCSAFISRILFGGRDGTPDSRLYALTFFLVRLWCARKPRPVIRDEKLKAADVPYVLLSNHESFFDFFSFIT